MIAAGQEKKSAQVVAAAEAGRLFAATYYLRRAWIDAAANAYVADQKPTAGATRQAFEEEWVKFGKHLDELDTKVRRIPLAKFPAAIRAQIESAQLQSRTYYKASRLYGLEAGLENGLYYMGLADGYLNFSIFIGGLDFPSPAATPAKRGHCAGTGSRRG